MTDGDFSFWKWVGSALVGLISGSALTGWVGRGVLADNSQAHANLASEIASVKTELTGKINAVEAAQRDCPVKMRIEFDGLVERVVNRVTMQQAQQMQEIKTDLAVLVALHGEMKQDVEAIFSRLNRREQDLGRPAGDRRWPNAQIDG